MSTRAIAFAVITFSAFATGCSAPQPRTAIPQTSTVGDPPIVFAGSYNVERTQLTLTANEEPFMRGTFPPFTPVLNLNGTYKNTPVRAECYFSSVLSEKGGLVGLISSTVQNNNSKTGDVCRMLVETDEAAVLNF